MPDSSGNCNEGGVEYVTRKRYIRGAHQAEQLGKVLVRRVAHEEAGREHPKFVQRLQCLTEGIKHRKEHERTEDDQHHVDTDIASDGAVKMVRFDFKFKLFLFHLTYLPSREVYLPACYSRS